MNINEMGGLKCLKQYTHGSCSVVSGTPQKNVNVRNLKAPRESLLWHLNDTLDLF